MMTKELLRRAPLLAGLSENDLDRLYGMSETIPVPAGAVLIQQGTASDAMYVVLSGELEVTKHAGKSEVVLARLGAGDVVGETGLIEVAPRNASVRAVGICEVMMIRHEAFQELVLNNPAMLVATLRTVTERLHNTESMLRQSEKMVELGKLAAGLAHELNNPAAAAKRSATLLRESLATWLSIAAQLDALHLNEAQIAARSALRDEMGKRQALSATFDPIQRSDMENTVQDWLEGVGVDMAWDVASVVVAYTWTVDSLRAAASVFSTEQLPVLLPWLSAGYSVYGLLDEVGVSVARISDIVKTVKEYSYLDRAPIQQVNVQDGLESTLLIMKHKLQTGINIVRDYAGDLPRIEAYASELNQVWTNIIDNALDAMGGNGELRIHTYLSDDKVGVDICDNGPGIPADHLQHIFENLFTTKPIGLGTGQGLYIAHNIVSVKHGGELTVLSKPGHTCFQVLLPTRITRE